MAQAIAICSHSIACHSTPLTSVSILFMSCVQPPKQGGESDVITMTINATAGALVAGSMIAAGAAAEGQDEKSSNKAIQANINVLAKAGAKYDTLAHDTGVLILTHAATYGDYRKMEAYIAAFGKGYRVEGVKFWVEQYSPLRWNGDGKLGMLKEGAKTYTPFNVEAANENPFWTLAGANETLKVGKLSPEALAKFIAKQLEYVNGADDKGDIYNKEGKLTKQVTNVVLMKDYLNSLSAVAVPVAKAA